jgi:periplasmic protein CpxP/Spy
MSNLTTKTARALGVPALLTILALALPAPAGAQQSTVTPAPSTSAPATPSTPEHTTPRRTRGGGTSGVDRRIADLHTRLKITPDQEAQWKQVADIMRQNAADVEAAVKERAQTAKSMTAMDNLHSYEKIAQAHEAGLQRLIPAFQTLYDSMPDAQKKNADEVFRASAQRRAARSGRTG